MYAHMCTCTSSLRAPGPLQVHVKNGDMFSCFICACARLYAWVPFWWGGRMRDLTASSTVPRAWMRKQFSGLSSGHGEGWWQSVWFIYCGRKGCGSDLCYSEGNQIVYCLLDQGIWRVLCCQAWVCCELANDRAHWPWLNFGIFLRGCSS